MTNRANGASSAAGRDRPETHVICLCSLQPRSTDHRAAQGGPAAAGGGDSGRDAARQTEGAYRSGWPRPPLGFPEPPLPLKLYYFQILRCLRTLE
jgi:hypothetical protein